jgi:hypothetical protein
MPLAALSPEGAALIAAGVAATVNVVGLGVAHLLTLRRERRSHRREEVGEVIKRAALALYVNTDDASSDELATAAPGSFAARMPRAAAVMVRGIPRYTELAVTLGDDLPLVGR